MKQKKIKNSDMRVLLEYGESLGWAAEHTRNNHIKFVRPGSPAVFTSGTPSDVRSWKNCKAKLKRNTVQAVA